MSRNTWLRSCDHLSDAREGRWAYQHGGDFGNDGGVTNWWPKPSVFPSGLTDWLGLPLSLYSSSYSGDNIYLGQYDWKVDSLKHALPVDRRFYDDIFRNASFGKPRDDPRRTGIRMFEQDFLCSINGKTQLTNGPPLRSHSAFCVGDAAPLTVESSVPLQVT